MPELRECVHKDVEGGVYTSGDPYGTRRKLGLTEFETKFFCWDCYNEFGADWGKSNAQQIRDEIQHRNLCGFRDYWIDICLNPKPCPKHQEKCWKCGALATSNCGETSMLVCGMPQCDEHPHIHERKSDAIRP